MSKPATARSAVATLWKELGLPSSVLESLNFTEDPDKAVPSSFRLGTAAQASIGLAGLSAAHLYNLAEGCEQRVSVDARHAALEFKSEALYSINDSLPQASLWDEIAGLYRTRDGFVRIHTNFPHHRQGIVSLLKCNATKDSVAEALLDWSAVDFETAAANHNVCATALRSFEQWDAHAQGVALVGISPVRLVKMGEAPKRVLRAGRSHPLEDMRVLDLSRVIAAPVCGRTLAAHGADVLWITSPNLPDLPFLDVETSRGKRPARVDLTTSEGCKTLATLSKDTDVFLQAYRPGGLRHKGFGPENLARLHPGVVYASLNAYGWEGPWKDRRGFDSLVQTATGFNEAEARAFASFAGEHGGPLKPKPFPMQALDHAAGYLLAFGINAALCKTVTEGGSWEVRVSLASVGQWIRSLGRLDPEVAFARATPLPKPLDPEISALATHIDRHTMPQSARKSDTSAESGDSMTAISHAARLEKTPAREGWGPMMLDDYRPEWLPLT